MAPIVAPGIVRYAVNGTSGIRNWTNILDFDMLADVSVDRADMAADHAQVIANAWGSEITPYQVNDSNVRSISWVDLNDLDGSTGSLPVNLVGGDGTEPASAQVSVLVQKVCAANGRGRRNGRFYLAGVPENAIGLDATNPGFLTPFNADLAVFLDAVSDFPNVGPFTGYSAFLSVLHTRNEGTPAQPDLVYNGHSRVTSLLAVAQIGTQRRRVKR